jgi:hypothetical protein
MSEQSNCAIAVIGVDIGMNPFHRARSAWCNRAAAEMVA